MARNTKKERARQAELERQQALRNNKQSMYENLFNSPDALTQQDIGYQQDLHNDVRRMTQQVDADMNVRQVNEATAKQTERNRVKSVEKAKNLARGDIDAINLAHDDAIIEDLVRDIANGTRTTAEANAILNKKRRAGEIKDNETLGKAKSVLNQNAEDLYKYNPTEAKGPIKLKRGEGTYKGTGSNHVRREHVGFKDDAKFWLNEERFPKVSEALNGMRNENAAELGNSYLKKALSGRNLNALLNIGLSINDYNEARNAGDGVVKAGVKAGAQFVAGEMLGAWMMPVMLAKNLPSLAVSAVETTQNVTRKMNSATRIQTFGEVQFQDTQQLATMRQAGMEMAKMSQYNLQQAIMGNEAQYMRRL